jgi:uncharacterized membrane-anchored protein YitT (DUF2179 family)
MLLTHITILPLSIFLLFINLPFIALGYNQIGKAFAIKSALAIAGLSICLTIINFPEVTSDKLLTAVFGGFFIGAGIGLAMRGGAVLDGTEVLAVIISKASPMFKVSDVILLLNILIFSAAALILSMELALYSILTYFAASKTIDFLVQGIEEYIGVTIISSHSDEIRLAIIERLGRGVTIYNGKRGYGKKGDRNADTDIVFTVITRLEVGKLQTEINRIDADAFVIQHSINDTKGGMIKKRPLH